MPPPPLKCENRVYVHSNFASSTAYLLGVLLPQHEPKTEFCLVKDDTVSLRDGYEDEVREERRREEKRREIRYSKREKKLINSKHLYKPSRLHNNNTPHTPQLHSLWMSLANPKAVLTLPRTTSLDPTTGVPTSTPSPPSPVQSSLSLSFVYSPCSFWQEVQPDPLYPYLPSPDIDMAHAVRGFSRGWDYASFPYESVVYTSPKNNMPYRYTMKGEDPVQRKKSTTDRGDDPLRVSDPLPCAPASPRRFASPLGCSFLLLSSQVKRPLWPKTASNVSRRFSSSGEGSGRSTARGSEATASSRPGRSSSSSRSRASSTGGGRAWCTVKALPSSRLERIER